MNRREAERACAEIQNLVPRDLVEQMRYRRQVVPSNPNQSVAQNAFRFAYLPSEAFLWDTASIETAVYVAPVTGQGVISEAFDVTVNITGGHEGIRRVRVSEVAGRRYALVEWLAPEGRCSDHGDVERHREQVVERVPHTDRWKCDNAPGNHLFSRHESCRFNNHEGDPWCGEVFRTERAQEIIDEGIPIGFSDYGKSHALTFRWQAYLMARSRGVTRARLRAEDHEPDNGILRWAETGSEEYQRFLDDLPNHYQATWRSG